jgi:3-hydroxy-3-methylglutaryl CoA synthase
MTHRDDSYRTTTMEPPARPPTHVPMGTSHADAAEAAYKADRRKTGLRDIVGGLVLIAIGFAYGGSIFMGTADVIDWAFDLVGTFWLLKGLYLLCT